MMDGKPGIDEERMMDLVRIPESIAVLEEMQECSDELPKDIVNIGNYKCRKNWWQELIEELESLLLAKIFDGQQIEDEINKFIELYTANEFKKKERVERQDIDSANTIIAKVLKLLRQMK